MAPILHAVVAAVWRPLLITVLLCCVAVDTVSGINVTACCPQFRKVQGHSKSLKGQSRDNFEIHLWYG
jgi:hypothetical protein